MSSHDAYAEPERGRTTTVVLLALLILTVIGALFGFVLGRRDKSDAASGPGNGQSSLPSTVTTTRAPEREKCPDFIQQGAVKQKPSVQLPLTLELWIRTKDHEVWMCREANNGGLWYQGHDKKKGFYPDEIPEEGVTGVLLSKNVTNAGENKFIVETNGVTRNVSLQRLWLSDGSIDQPVVDSRVPK